ncbi:hypothetical protein CDAR_375851 [Caerostris darwini]|uniref:Uncharacterized protein n=1 Tax=Caerostris darwini TaxID=1538125 RepID=A0AAV4S5C0_9ARAC|nr:hypothetical protein CDAR_375851 [Caerostris darwini]
MESTEDTHMIRHPSQTAGGALLPIIAAGGGEGVGMKQNLPSSSGGVRVAEEDYSCFKRRWGIKWASEYGFQATHLHRNKVCLLKGTRPPFRFRMDEQFLGGISQPSEITSKIHPHFLLHIRLDPLSTDEATASRTKEQNSNNKPKKKAEHFVKQGGLFAEEKDGDRYEYRSWAVDWTRAKGRFIRMLMERSLMRFLLYEGTVRQALLP